MAVFLQRKMKFAVNFIDKLEIIKVNRAFLCSVAGAGHAAARSRPRKARRRIVQRQRSGRRLAACLRFETQAAGTVARAPPKVMTARWSLRTRKRSAQLRL